MQSFQTLSEKFNSLFDQRHFPESPATLYDPNEYFLKMGGKRVRPVLCVMGNELIDDIKEDAWHVGKAIELFHNFTLIHDDIMDKAPLRRGKETVHKKYGDSTAILAGDVMLIKAYHELSKIDVNFLKPILTLFNKTATEVCEGQQLDMDFESRIDVSLEEYIYMIELKTSVALAASLQAGAIIANASERNGDLLYQFGRKLGIAFQIQDDYLDCFGDAAKFGKQIGGDILANKKTFLLIRVLETATEGQRKKLLQLMEENPADKVEQVLALYKDCQVDKWALALKEKYYLEAIAHLEDIAVLTKRKEPLRELAAYLIQRDV